MTELPHIQSEIPVVVVSAESRESMRRSTYANHWNQNSTSLIIAHGGEGRPERNWGTFKLTPLELDIVISVGAFRTDLQRFRVLLKRRRSLSGGAGEGAEVGPRHPRARAR